MGKKVLLLGASGLTGSFCLEYLLSSSAIEMVICPVRRDLEVKSPKLKQVLTDFSNPDTVLPEGKIDVIINCMGTTIKKAGSQEKFRFVDLDLPLIFAKIAKNRGAKSCMLLTAVGADKNSSVFYNQVKGELEHEIKGLKFDNLNIFQPGLILGKRNEVRFAEQIAQWVSPVFSLLLIGNLGKYQSVPAQKIAQSIAKHTINPGNGTSIVKANEMNT